VFQKQSVFLVGGIVSNRATIANFKGTLSREIVEPPGPNNFARQPFPSSSARNWLSLAVLYNRLVGAS
jgi:hypothetical protein